METGAPQLRCHRKISHEAVHLPNCVDAMTRSLGKSRNLLKDAPVHLDSGVAAKNPWDKGRV
jgi:hypothetical protein